MALQIRRRGDGLMDYRPSSRLFLPQDVERRIIVPPAIVPPPPGWLPRVPTRGPRPTHRWSPDILRIPRRECAIAFVQQAENAGDGSATTITVALGNTTTANLLVCGVAWSGSGVNINTVASPGNSLVAARAKTAHSGNTDFYQIWYLENITGETTPTVTVTFSVNATFRRIGMHEVSGLATTGALDQTNGGTDDIGTTVAPGNVTTTVADEYLFAGGTSFEAQTFTPGTSWTARATPSTDNFTQDRIVAATGTYATSYTQSSSAAWIAQAATFKIAAAGGGGQPPRTMHQARMRR